MKARLYMSIFVTYLFIFLYPLCFSLFYYNQVIGVVKNDSQESNISALEKCCQIIDERLAETRGLTDQISKAACASNLVYCPNPDIDQRSIIKMINFRDSLKSYLCSNNFVQDVYVYFKDPGIVVGSQEMFFNNSQFYDSFMQYSDMTSGEWNHMMQGIRGNSKLLPVATVKRFQRVDRMMVYIKGLPDYTGSIGAVVTLIPEYQVISTIKDKYLEEHGSFEILDADQNTILSYDNGLDLKSYDGISYDENSGHQELKVNGRSYLLSYTTSPNNGWKYVGILPYSTVMKKVDGLHRVTELTMILCIVTGLAVIFLIATQKSHHVRNLAGILVDRLNVPYRGRNSDIKLIDQSLTGLIDDNASLKNNMQRMLPMLQNTFVEKLLKREFSSGQEIDWAISQFGLPELRGKKIVVCVKIDSDPQRDVQTDLMRFNTAKVRIEEALHRRFNDFYLYNKNFDSNVYIVSLTSVGTVDLDEYIDTELNRVCQSIYEAHEISLFFSVGTVFENMMDASESYNAANVAIDNNILVNNKNVLWYKDVKQGKDCFYYPVEFEIQLLNNLKEGHFNKVKYILDHLYKENFVKRNLSCFMSKSLINEVYSTLIKTNSLLDLESYPEGKLVGELILKIERRQNSVEKIFEDYSSICSRICEIVGIAKNISITSRKINTIIEYVRLNFADLDMNLASIADKFGFAPPYLSKVFKENTGMNFSVYLEKLRISKGCELLNQSGNIEEVSHKAGYNSINAFRKAFKKIMNITPSEYRFQQRGINKPIADKSSREDY